MALERLESATLEETCAWLRETRGISMTPEELWNASPTGQLAHVSWLRVEAALAKSRRRLVVLKRRSDLGSVGDLFSIAPEDEVPEGFAAA